MSLKDRASLAALAEIDGGDGVRDLLLGVLGRHDQGRGARAKAADLPRTWTVVHVLDRLEEAFRVLAAMPAATRPKSYGNAMPEIVRERLPLIVEFELDTAGELEQMHRDRNRVRLSVTASQISRMDQALHWPVDYLRSYPEVSRSLCRKALWEAMGVDVPKRCERLGINRHFFNRQWQHGLAIVATRLIARKVPVT